MQKWRKVLVQQGLGRIHAQIVIKGRGLPAACASSSRVHVIDDNFYYVNLEQNTHGDAQGMRQGEKAGFWHVDLQGIDNISAPPQNQRLQPAGVFFGLQSADTAADDRKRIERPGEASKHCATRDSHKNNQ